MSEYRVPTVKVKDGNGSFIVINKDDLQSHHELHKDGESAAKNPESLAPASERKSRRQD
jgi:hypothetical protein